MSYVGLCTPKPCLIFVEDLTYAFYGNSTLAFPLWFGFQSLEMCTSNLLIFHLTYYSSANPPHVNLCAICFVRS